MPDHRDNSLDRIIPELETLNEFFDSLGAALVFVSPEHRILYMNSLAESLWGRKSGEKCHHALRDSRGVCRGCPVPRLLKKPGAEKRLMSMYSPGGPQDHENLFLSVRGTSDTVQFVVLMSMNLEERKRLEREVALEKELRRAIMLSTNALVMGMDESGRVTFVNKTGERVSGYAEDEIIEGGGFSVIIPEQFQRTLAGALRAASENNPEHSTLLAPLLTKSGEEKKVSWSFSPLVGEEGVLKGTVGLGQDVTEQARLVESLSESEEKYRTLVETSLNAVFMVTTDGEILFANRAAAGVAGLGYGELIGRDIFSFIHPDERDSAREFFTSRWKEGGGVERRSVRISDSRGEMFFEVTTAMLGSTGKVKEVMVIANDVTERELTERKLKESEERYRTIVESSRDAIIMTNRAGEVLYANPEGENLFGVRLEDTIGEHLFKYVHPNDRERAARDFIEDWKTGNTIPHYPVRCVRNDGTVLYIEATSGLVGWPKDDAVQIFVLRDVTERRRQEEETSRWANQLESLNEIAKASTSSLDLPTVAGAITDVVVNVTGADAGIMLLVLPVGGGTPRVTANKGFDPVVESALGREQMGRDIVKIVMGRRGTAYCPGSGFESPVWAEQIQGILEPHGITSAVLVPLKSGEKLLGAIVLGARRDDHFDERDRSFFNAAGSEIGVSVENAIFYRELAEEHERLSTLYKGIRGITTEIELDSLLKRIAAESAGAIGASAALVALVDGELEEFTLRASFNTDIKRLAQVHIPLDGGAGGEALKTRKAVCSQPGEEAPGCFRDDPVVGALGISSGVVVPMITSDIVVGALMVILEEGGERAGEEDILMLEAMGRQAGMAIENARLYEETREHLKALEQAHGELMELDRMKSDFVSTVSHELRSPLAVIKGFAKTLVEHFDRIDDVTARESLEIMLKKSISLEGLIENILDMSRIEGGRLGVTAEDIDLVGLCEQVRREQDRVAELHDVGVVSEDDEVLVFADREKTEVVLSNLLFNAIKFSPDGGVVKISIAKVGRYAEVSVADEGIGISRAEQEKIFERFYQVDRGETRSFPGSGLGLYITEELVSVMGGKVSVGSEPGKGSVFTFTLPLAR